MKELQKKIIEKQDDIIAYYQNLPIEEKYKSLWIKKGLDLFEELSDLKSQLSTCPEITQGEKFVKVYIKTEADLPEKEGTYHINHKSNCSPHPNLYAYLYELTKDSKNWWLENVNWYLLPQPPAEQLSARREELIKFLNTCDYEISQAFASNEVIVNNYLNNK